MKQRLDHVPRYRNFVNDLGRVQEQVLWNTQTDISRFSADAFERIRQVVAHRYSLIPADDLFGAQASRHLSALDSQIEYIFKELAIHITARIMRMRKATFILSYLGEFEAVARTIKPKGEEAPQVRISQSDISKKISALTLTGHRLDHRITLSLSRIRRKVMDAVELSRINEDDTRACLERIENCFPKKIGYKRPPRILKPLKEAEGGGKKEPVSVGFLDPGEWQEVVDEYTSTELPPSRFDNEPKDVQLKGEQDLTEMYAWEIEQEATNDFVRSVREASKEAQEKLGVSDFIWVAVLDNATDECCEWRNGLSTSEIRDALSDDHSDDECEVEVPPAHFNCRCTLAPVAEVPERIEDEVGGVNDWLDSLRD